MSERHYNIHDIVSFRIIGEPGFASRLITNFEAQYLSFTSAETDMPDITFVLGSFAPKNTDCYILDDYCYVKEGYLYCEDSYKVAKWRLEISGFESAHWEVRIDANLFGWEMVPGFIMDPLIIMKMNEKGASVVHGSAVSKDGKAYVFSAQGGAGKTSTALYAVEKGYSFLGDNFVAIRDGRALSLLYPLNLFPFNLTPVIKRNVGMASKTRIWLMDMATRATGFGAATKVNPGTALRGSVADEAELGGVFLLLPKGEFRVVELDRDQMIEHLVSNLKLDILSFTKYLLEYSYRFPGSGVAGFWERYLGTLQKNLNGSLPFYRVEVPMKYSPQTFVRIEETICRGVGTL